MSERVRIKRGEITLFRSYLQSYRLFIGIQNGSSGDCLTPLQLISCPTAQTSSRHKFISFVMTSSNQSSTCILTRKSSPTRSLLPFLLDSSRRWVHRRTNQLVDLISTLSGGNTFNHPWLFLASSHRNPTSKRCKSHNFQDKRFCKQLKCIVYLFMLFSFQVNAFSFELS